MIYLLLLMTLRFANDVILTQVLQKKFPWKIVIFIVIVLHSSVVVWLRFSGYIVYH